MLKDIKHEFLAYRNGIVADTLRKAGFPHKIIFGLQLPQLSEIAGRQTPSLELANALWSDNEVRESRLLACYLFPRDEVAEEMALDLANSVRTNEEADILTFRLLRHLPFAEELRNKLASLYPGGYIVKAMDRFIEK